MGNRVAYFEVGSADFERLLSFYRDLFGWRVQGASDGYAMVDTRAGGGINGGIGRSRDGGPWVSFYVAAEDPQAVLDRARSLGGGTVVPITDGYRLVETGAGEGAIGGGLGGAAGGDGGGGAATWATVYANVPDVAAILARAEELGGSRVYGPNQVDDHMRTGALRDPSGNVFGVYEHHH